MTAGDGSLLVCGDGLATLADVQPESLAKVRARLAREGTAQGARVDEELELAIADASVASTPRRPTAAWLPRLHLQRVEHVACAGQHTLVLAQGAQRGASSLGRELWRDARAATTRDRDCEDETELDDVDCDSPADFGVDCLLLPGGGAPLYAHRAVLAARSPLFAELIMLEQREDGDEEDGVLQLLVPDLSPHVAKALLEFVYCDDLFEPVGGSGRLHPALVAELGAAGARYGLPRLAAICAAATGAARRLDCDFDEQAEDAQPLVPRSSCNAAWLGLVGDPSFADVKIVAEDAPIYVHRVVLARRSEYFRAMFASGMAEGAAAGERYDSRAQPLEIVVPDTHVGMLRLLNAIYTDTLADADAAQLLEDLVAADRYGLSRAFGACESALAVLEPEEAVAALGVAHAVGAEALVTALLAHCASRLPETVCASGFEALQTHTPQLLERLLAVLVRTRPRLLRPAKPALAPRSVADPADESAADQSSLLSLRHASALLAVAIGSLTLQNYFRLRDYANVVINLLFFLAVFLLFWDDARRKALSRKRNE